MYLVKHLIGALATPLMIALLICVVAGICRAFERRKIASWLLISSLAIIYLAAISPVSGALLGPLERRYPPLPQGKSLPAVEFVVVLGSGYTPHGGVPVTAALDEEGLVRIAEGIRLFRRLGAAHLIVSGGAPAGQIPPALGYAEFAREFGVGDASLIVLDRALDTRGEAQAVASLLGAMPFLLVTSASHMPRAMRLMEGAGAHAIPAPTGQHIDNLSRANWRSLVPTADGLRKTDLAIHEYLGFAAIATGLG